MIYLLLQKEGKRKVIDFSPIHFFMLFICGQIQLYVRQIKPIQYHSQAATHA